MLDITGNKDTDTELLKQQLKKDLTTGGAMKQNMVSSIDRPLAPESDFASVRYDVPTSAIYDRRRDGTYTPKFKNYVGAFDNEDRLAKQQGAGEKIVTGLTRLTSKAGLYALDATLGTAYGIFNGIKDESFSSVWDNDLSNWIDELNKDLDYALPIYKSNEYKSGNILENIFKEPLTFISGDLSDGLAFVGGALLPEAAIMILSGGASLPTSIAKFSAKGALKGFSKTAAKNQAKNLAITSKRVYDAAKLGEGAGNFLKTTGFLVRTSNFEASVEARHNFHESVDNYLHKFEEANGKAPTKDELLDYLDIAKSAANTVWGTNMAILSVSNVAMFGKTFGIMNRTRDKVNNFGNSLIGLTPKAGKVVGETVAKAPTLANKITGNAYKILSKPVIEGIYEEGFQGVAGKTMQGYLEASYNPEVEAGYDMWSAITEGFYETYATKDGWKEIGIGMIIGSLGGVMQGGPIAGTFSDSYSAGISNLKTRVEAQNEAYRHASKLINTSLRNATAARVYRQSLEGDSSTVGKSDMDNTMVNLSYLRAQEHLKTTEEMVRDYEVVLNNTEFDPEVKEELGGNDAEYKAQLVEEFKQTAESYKRATYLTRALGINEKLQISEGNTALVQDFLVTSMVAADTAQRVTKEIGEQIESLTGKDGILNALEFYSNLDAEGKQLAQELNSKNEKLLILEEKYKDYSMRLAGIQEANLSDKGMEKIRNRVAEIRMKTSEEVLKLKAEIETTEKILDKKFAPEKTQLQGDGIEGMGFTDVNSNIKVINELNKYVGVMKDSGKKTEAETLEYLLEQYKDYMDANREMNNMFRAMGDTNFLTSNRGQGVLGSILGTRYKMSDELKKEIKDNNESIDRSLQKVGVRGYESVEKLIEETLEKNPKLSDREKFRLETIFRMTLSVQGIQNKVNQNLQTLSAQELEAVKETDTELQGDTVAVRRSVQLTEDNMNNVDVLNVAIAEMLQAVDAIRGKDNKMSEEDTTKLNELQAELEVLQAKMEEEGAETEAIQKEIKEKAQEIDALVKASSQRTVRLIESEDYIRLEALNQKALTEDGLTQEEVQEKTELEDYMDQWMYFTGAVVEGNRLSDLIRLKVQLETTEIADLEKVENIDSYQKSLRVDFPDKGSSANYSLAQQYATVTAVGLEDGNISVSGLSLSDLKDVAGVDFPTVENLEENEKGNTVITPSVASMLNRTSNLKVNPPRENSNTVYSVVLQKDADGNLSPLKSNFGSTGFDKTMDVNISYTLANKDNINLSVSPKDSKNKELIDAYNNAVTVEDREAALERLAKSLVIRVNTNKDNKSHFIGVLKGKRKVDRKGKNDLSFEAMRNQIVNDPEFLGQILSTPLTRNIPIKGQPKVKKVYLGHPNLNYVEAADGAVSVESRPFTEQDTKKVVDIGYVHKGKFDTRSGKVGIDTSYISKDIKKAGDGKVPFIVFEFHGRRIAYPVQMRKQEAPDNTILEEIFKSNATNESKVTRLNSILAERGIDIKGRGDAFTFQNIENNEFFDNKLAQLNAIDYFYRLEDWTNSKVDMAGLLQEQALLDINLSDPLHSPKVQIDYSDLKVDMSNTEVNKSVVPIVPKKKKTNAKKDLKDNC